MCFSCQIRLLFARTLAIQRQLSAGPSGSGFFFSHSLHLLALTSKASLSSLRLAACLLCGSARFAVFRSTGRLLCQFHGHEPYSLPLHRIQRGIRRIQQWSNGFRIPWIRCHSHTHRQRWLFHILRKQLADSLAYQFRVGRAGFRQHQRKLIPALPGSRVNGSAATPQCVRQTAKRTVSNQVTVLVVDPLKLVHVQQHQCELSPRPLRSAYLCVQHLEEAPVIRQSRQRIAVRLPTESLLERLLLRYVSNYHLVPVESPAPRVHSTPAQSDHHRPAIFAMALHLEALDFATFSQALTPSIAHRWISNHIPRKVRFQKFLSRGVP